jgi:uroporphyrinogen decarboxylase
MSTMTPGERVRAAVKGEPVDRVPLVFWHHFKPEGSGEKLAEFTINFFVDTFKLDIAKIMPDLPYPKPDEDVADVSHIRLLPKLDLDTPAFREQLVCIRSIRQRIGNDYPLILTLFSPFTYVLRFMGKQRAIAALRANADPIEEGMGTIAANLRRLTEAAINEGASGIFFSCMGATTADLTLDEYSQHAYPYDIEALRGTAQGWLNIVHVHADPTQTSDQIYFEFFDRYPVQVISWSDRLTGPSLAEAAKLTGKALMGGLWERGALTHGSEAELKNEMLSSVSQVGGRRLILANGCSIPDDNPEEWLHTARRLVDNLS